jgi:hypothetical protein
MEKGRRRKREDCNEIVVHLSLSCLSLSPPKQQFFNCAIVEIIFPVLLVRALVPCCTLTLRGYRLPVTVPGGQEDARSSNSLSRKTEIALCVVADLTSVGSKKDFPQTLLPCVGPTAKGCYLVPANLH